MENENKSIDVSSPQDNPKDTPQTEGILGLLFLGAILYGGYLGWDWLSNSIPDIEMDPVVSQHVSIEDCEIVNDFIVSCVIGSKSGVTIRSDALIAVGFDADGVRLSAKTFPSNAIRGEERSRETVNFMDGGETKMIKITLK